MTSFIQDIDHMTLCIPRVFTNISENRIRNVFYALKLGDIGHIDMVSKVSPTGEKFNRVFIHFERWFETENAQSARKLLSEGKDIKVIYDEPWFWKVSTYRKPVHVKPVAFIPYNNRLCPQNIGISYNVPENNQIHEEEVVLPIQEEEEVISTQEEEDLNDREHTYDSSVPIIDYKAVAKVVKRRKLIPKKTTI